MKKTILLIVACTVLAGCNGRTDNNQNDADSSLVENEQVKTIPDSMLIMTDKKFDGYTLVELKANPLSNLNDGFGGIFHMSKGYSDETSFRAIYVGYWPGATKIESIKFVIDGENYTFLPSKSGTTEDGRIIAYSAPIEPFFEPLAAAKEVDMQLTFDNKQIEQKLTADDLKNFSDIYSAFEARRIVNNINK